MANGKISASGSAANKEAGNVSTAEFHGVVTSCQQFPPEGTARSVGSIGELTPRRARDGRQLKVRAH